jgi:hypothetical protein
LAAATGWLIDYDNHDADVAEAEIEEEGEIE